MKSYQIHTFLLDLKKNQLSQVKLQKLCIAEENQKQSQILFLLVHYQKCSLINSLGQTVCKLSVEFGMFWCHGKQGQHNSVNCLKRKGATTFTIFVQSLRDIEQLKLIPISMYMRVFLEFKIFDMLRCILLHSFSKVTLPQRFLYLKLLDFIVLIVDEV